MPASKNISGRRKTGSKNKRKPSWLSNIWGHRYAKPVVFVVAFMLIGGATLAWAMAATTTSSLWGDSTVPTTLSSADTSSTELGLRFKSNVAGYVTGVRFYKSAQNTGTHTGSLWDNKGRLLATVTFTNESTSGWQSANFDKPVSIASSTLYVISYHAPNGHYSYNAKYFSRSAYTNGHLTAVRNSSNRPNGIYTKSQNQNTFPTTSGNGTNYWVDPLFTTSLVNANPAPAAPANAVATAPNSTSVVVTWQESVSQSPIASYVVYRNGNKLANVGTALAYTDTSVTTGTTYTYQVQAVDSAGTTSVLSLGAQVTVPAPSGTGGSTSGWPNATNTGYEPTGVTLHACASLITASGTYDSCQFNSGVDVRANNVHITRSLIKGQIAAYSGFNGQQSGLVISDTTINCGCQSGSSAEFSASSSPAAIDEANYTLLRVNLYNSAHGAAVKTNVTIQDSWIHGLGGNTDAHKDGIFSGDGTNVTIRHNNIECNDGPVAGCTSAIGLLTDFADITYYTIDNNLLNTNGASCFYASGGPQKAYSSNHITFTNNHFGRAINGRCGDQGPVSYWDSSKPGMVWSGNVWDDTGVTVLPE